MSLMEVKLKIKEVPISSIIGQYIHLRARQPGNFLGLCPFHQDTRPSLHVSDTKGLFRCFPCDIGGDAITFVEKFARLTFIEAIKDIGQKLGIPIEELLDEQKADPKIQLALDLLQKTAQLYQREAEHAAPFHQFLQERLIPPEIATKFCLGHAPAYSGLTSRLLALSPEERDKKLSLALEVGVIRKGLQDRNGGCRYYDTFRERLLFPIHNHFGKVVAFGSRSLSDKAYAKYLNSQDSFIFNKRHILYGFYFAKQKIREQDQVIIVEGYMDLITLHKFGFTNSVAIMGVGISERSLQLLKNLTSNIVLALDSDEAGWKAMVRIHDECLKLGLTPKYLDFNPYKDPDEFLNQQGSEALHKRLQEAPLFLNTLLEKTIPSPLPEGSDQKLLVLKNIFKLLSPLKNNLVALEKIGEYAKRLELYTNHETLIQNYSDYLKETTQAPMVKKEKGPKKVTPPLPLPTQTETTETTPVPTLSKLEKSLLKEILLHPDCLQHPEVTEILENVVQPAVHSLIHSVRNLYYEIDESLYAQTIINYLAREYVNAELRQVVGSILFQYRPEMMSELAMNRLISDFKKRIEKGELLKMRQEFLRNLEENPNDMRGLNQLTQKLAAIEKAQ